MPASTTPCASCGRPLEPGTTCPNCPAPPDEAGLYAGGYIIVASIVVGCVLVVLKLLGFMD